MTSSPGRIAPRNETMSVWIADSFGAGSILVVLGHRGHVLHRDDRGRPSHLAVRPEVPLDHLHTLPDGLVDPNTCQKVPALAGRPDDPLDHAVHENLSALPLNVETALLLEHKVLIGKPLELSPEIVRRPVGWRPPPVRSRRARARGRQDLDNLARIDRAGRAGGRKEHVDHDGLTFSRYNLRYSTYEPYRS